MKRKHFSNVLDNFRKGPEKLAQEKVSEEELYELGLTSKKIAAMKKVANFMAHEQGTIQANVFLRKLAEAGVIPNAISDSEYYGETEGEKKRLNPNELGTDYLGPDLNSDEERALGLVDDLLSRKALEGLDGSGSGEVHSEYDDDEDGAFGDEKEASDRRFMSLVNMI